MTDLSSIQAVDTIHHAKKRRSKLSVVLLALAGAILVLFIAIQFIPVNRANPAVTAQIQWDSQQTKDLAYRACMDCHSNETTWPVYAYVAPASWLIYYDVERGRSEWNLSTASSGSFIRPETTQTHDLAYRLGQILAGGQQRPGPDGGQPPEGQVPSQNFPPTQGQFPGGGGGFNMSDRLTENIQNNQMPPSKYILMHPTANLSAEERQQLVQGLTKTLGLSTQ